jgi:hypothetical protein
MNIIELAKEYGDSTWIDDKPLSFTFANADLQAFATAIIENYKAGLVPVAEITRIYPETRMSPSLDWEGDTLALPVGTPLYALTLGETK